MRTRHATLLLLLPAFAACSTVPGTGRSRLDLVPLDTEMSMGSQAYKETLSQSKLIKSGPDYEMVQRLGHRIADAAERLYPDSPAKEFKWEFNLIDDPKTINAWCLPGGKVAVYTGLLPVTKDEASLAVVVGHEVGHAVARHGGERMTQQLGVQGALTAASIYLSGNRNMSSSEQQGIMAALGMGANVGLLLPYSRTHESEADELGLYMAASAGYDPHASIGLWQRMAASGGSAPPEFLSTHPSDASRIQNLQEHMNKAMRYYREAQKAGRAAQ